jgi:hypothetical protein
MAGKKFYALPDYAKVTADIDEYISAWQGMAKPVETALNLTLSGFDPEFVFTKGNPNSGNAITVSLPVWFVRDLSQSLTGAQNAV